MVYDKNYILKQYKTLIQLVLDNNNLGLVIKPKNQVKIIYSELERELFN